MNKKKIICILAMIGISVGLLAGCGNSRKEDEDAYRQIGINSMESGDYESAIAAFDNALGQKIGNISKDEIDICYYKAAAQYANGDVEGAIATYTALIAYDDKEANAYYLRGCLYLKQGNTEAALQEFDSAVKNNSNDYELYVSIYENLASYDMASDGEKYLNDAFSIKGNAAENLAWRGKIYYLLGQYDNAAKELSSAIEAGSMVANLYIAQVYEAQGDSASAESYYQTYAQSDAADSVAMNALGEIEISKGNYAGALTYLEQGISMDEVTNKRQLMQNLVIAYEYSGDFTSAWNIIQEYITLYPEDANAQREYTFLKNRQPKEETVEAETTETEGTESVEDTEMSDTTVSE